MTTKFFCREMGVPEESRKEREIRIPCPCSMCKSGAGAFNILLTDIKSRYENDYFFNFLQGEKIPIYAKDIYTL